MGRKRTRLNLTAAQRAQALQQFRLSKDARERERLGFALRAARGRHTLEDLAIQLGRSRSTIQNWLDKFNAGGLAGLLNRDTPPGAVSPLAKPRLQKQLRQGLQAGRWSSAAGIARWLKQAHGIKRNRKSIYYWLAKNGCPAPGAALHCGAPDRRRNRQT